MNADNFKPVNSVCKFPNTHLKRGVEWAEHLRNNLPIHVDLTPCATHQLCWRSGLSEFKKDDINENIILSRAETALLEAKRNGRPDQTYCLIFSLCLGGKYIG